MFVVFLGLMTGLEAQLEELDEQKQVILAKVKVRNAGRKIRCGSCEDSHKIEDLSAIQTYWYTQPHGCTGGDYWSEGELQYVCPENGVRNRLLFDNNDIPHEERKQFNNNPEKQFSSMYKGLFKAVEDIYGESGAGEWVNNHYVDRNRKKFGLVEKRKVE